MASLIRLHVPFNLCAGAPIGTTPAQAHYLGSVMRRKPGDQIRVFNEACGEWAAGIDRIGRQGAELRVGMQLRAASPEPDCWLVFAPVKRDGTDLIVEKATELGVSALVPVFTAHSQTARINHDRLTAIATEAAEQSERLSVPVVHEAVDLATFLADFPQDRRLLVAAERRDATRLDGVSPAQPHALLIGPEGGFAPAELDAMAQLAFVTLITLGPRILRAETAAIAGLARMLASPDRI